MSIPDMGLAPGGLMRQRIYEDKYGIDTWDQDHVHRCFVHLINSVEYKVITGREPPQMPVTAKDYTRAGLPWFEYYDDSKTVQKSTTLAKMRSLGALTVEKTQNLLKDNESVTPSNVKKIIGKRSVRDGHF
jgi:hypothetical protein